MLRLLQLLTVCSLPVYPCSSSEHGVRAMDALCPPGSSLLHQATASGSAPLLQVGGLAWRCTLPCLSNQLHCGGMQPETQRLPLLSASLPLQLPLQVLATWGQQQGHVWSITTPAGSADLTPLHLAAAVRNFPLVKALFGERGSSPLLSLCSQQLLLGSGAVTVHLASSSGRQPPVWMHLPADMDPASARLAWHSARTADGLTPAAFAELAKQHQQPQVQRQAAAHPALPSLPAVAAAGPGKAAPAAGVLAPAEQASAEGATELEQVGSGLQSVLHSELYLAGGPLAAASATTAAAAGAGAAVEVAAKPQPLLLPCSMCRGLRWQCQAGPAGCAAAAAGGRGALARSSSDSTSERSGRIPRADGIAGSSQSSSAPGSISPSSSGTSNSSSLMHKSSTSVAAGHGSCACISVSSCSSSSRGQLPTAADHSSAGLSSVASSPLPPPAQGGTAGASSLLQQGPPTPDGRPARLSSERAADLQAEVAAAAANADCRAGASRSRRSAAGAAPSARLLGRCLCVLGICGILT